VRFSISPMDVPTRQSYTMAVVRPAERSAAAGVTGVARTIGAAISPAIAGAMLGRPAWIGAPFFLAGGSKIVYDLILYRMFRGTRPPEERVVQWLCGDDAEAKETVAELIAQWQPQALIVGLPLHADGTPHELTARARRFARQLAGRFALPVHEVDERYTSELARAELRSTRQGGREHRSAVDAVAAQLILQAWLDTPHDPPPAS